MADTTPVQPATIATAPAAVAPHIVQTAGHGGGGFQGGGFHGGGDRGGWHGDRGWHGDNGWGNWVCWGPERAKTRPGYAAFTDTAGRTWNGHPKARPRP